ncbi:MAG: tetratricopeptide repeat protein [Vicinamibacteria bacterium]
MADPSRRAADHGLFLKHFSAGRQLYDAGSLPESERELEEAYLLRPRDHKVLNLLGLVYFKQEKLEKAEEVYRKLAAESPEAHTLFYNLGLIYFKLGRLEDAELAFLKALGLSKDNPKINFYLGSIYEKLRRFQDAIFQYRQAGASIMVRRMESRLTPEPRASTKAPRSDDTAEFHASEIKAQLDRTQPPPTPATETEPFVMPAKKLEPVSDVLLADGAPLRAAESPSSARARTERVSSKTLPPPTPALPANRRADIVAFLATLPPSRPGERAPTGISSGSSRREPSVPTPATPAPAVAEPFRLLQKNLLEASFSGKLFVKQGTIYSYSGNLTFWVKEKRPGGASVLVIVTGTGKVLLTDRDRDVSVMAVEAEPIHVQPSLLLACEESLTPRYAPIGDGDDAPEFLALEGRGQIALSVGNRPLILSVSPEMPVSVAAHTLIMWTGALRASRVRDPQLSEALASPRGDASMIRLEGSGRVLVEQVI